MNFLELLIIAVGLSMDAFAVSICRGLSIKKINLKTALIVGLYFGFFQGMMPLIGYLLGSQFANKIVAFDHWIAFILLAIIGGKMIKESLEKEELEVSNESVQNEVSFKKMFPLAIATSIDALAVGVSFAFLKVSIVPAVIFIGVVTFILSAIGVKIGHTFGIKYKSKAEFSGGIILILMGIKILLEHLGIINI